MENINKSIGQDVDSKVQIGVLDIYGFESFKNNRYISLSFISFLLCTARLSQCTFKFFCPNELAISR